MIRAAVGFVAFELAHGLLFTDGPVVNLRQADFQNGTVRITAGGRYKLVGDVVFDPDFDAGRMSWSKFPHDSSAYPSNGGYVVGFFAAITIEADDVELDCKGYSLKMSPAFHKMQRYFSLIEVASSPFNPAEQQPFYDPDKLSATPANPGNFLLENCDLGLTSHYAIHTSGNARLTLRNLRIHDFEGGGIEINGNRATSISIENVDIGPSLAQTYRTPLYQAMIMDHILSTKMPEDPDMEGLATSTDVTIRNETLTVREWLGKLRTALQTYMEHGTGPMAAVAGAGTDLPDASAVYGILVHAELSHVDTLQDLFCPDNFLCDPDPESDLRVHDVTVRNTVIHDLGVRVAQKADVTYNARAQRGVTGEVFPMAEVWDQDHCYSYAGNVFTDAMLAAGRLSARAWRKTKRRKSPFAEATVARFLGKSYIAPQILKWAGGEGEDAGGLSCHESGDFILKIWRGAMKDQLKQNISCGADAYACRNIGAVGIRMDFVKDVALVNLTLGNFTNYGTLGAAPWCHTDSYTGLDVRGVTSTFVRNLSSVLLTQSGTFTSVEGGADHEFPGVTQSLPQPAP